MVILIQQEYALVFALSMRAIQVQPCLSNAWGDMVRLIVVGLEGDIFSGVTSCISDLQCSHVTTCMISGP